MERMPVHPDTRPLTENDIGTVVWAVMAVQPLEMCLHCGAPEKRCDHLEHWALVDIPGIVSGTLRAMQANLENTTVLYDVDGIGINQPLSVHRTRPDAMAAVSESCAKELSILSSWALGTLGRPIQSLTS